MKAVKVQEKKRTRRTWAGKQPLSKVIEAMGLKIKPSEALAKALAAGYDGATVQHVHRAQSALRRRTLAPAASAAGSPAPRAPKMRRPRRRALTDDERAFVALALKLGEENARALLQRVAHLRGMLGL